MEDQAEYVTEAMQLLNGEPSLVIEPERKIIERRGKELKETVVAAFVKISTSFKSELPEISDAALKVWIFIALSVNRNTGTANPGLRTIATALKKGVNTVQDCLKELEEIGLMQVDRKSRKFNIYEPLGYVSANRLDPVSEPDTDGESVSEKPESVSEKTESVSDSQILNQRNQNKPDILDGILKYQKPPEELEALHDFERSFGFGLLPWFSNTVWDKFAKWIIKQSAFGWFADYVKWREDLGKYKAFSNKKIRENPLAFIDTGYPEYEASKMYRKTDEVRPEYVLTRAPLEEDPNLISNPVKKNPFK